MLSDEQMKAAAEKAQQEYIDKIEKLCKSLHEYALLEAKSLSLHPEGICHALIVETAASIIALAAMSPDCNAVVTRFSDAFNVALVRGILSMIKKEAGLDKAH